MNLEDYRKWGKILIDYTADYLENIRERRIFPDVKPGYMRPLLPESAPIEGEKWEDIFNDIERVIMPGVTHWQSPHMHAYFPAINCPGSLLGDILSNAIGCLGFTWASSPACTELEIIVMDWLGKMIGLPEAFLHDHSNGLGGGVIQTSASEATFVALLAARTEVIQRVKKDYPDLDEAEINGRLVAYCSDQAHSSVEKAGLIGLVKMHYIESDENLSLRGEKLKETVERDKQKSLIPFFLCATLGTTGACSFDNLSELGPICQKENIWIHVDAAYAGTAFICPEFRKWMKGIEYVQSFAFNPSKWMMVHFDCTAMWVKNSGALHRTFNVNPLYLHHENTGLAIDFMHWQIPLSRRFRSLKLWFVIRSFGITGLQEHIRYTIKLAIEFEKLVQEDKRFEIPAKRHLGLIVFRLKGENELTEKLLKRLNSDGKIHCVPASLKGIYVIRFSVSSPRITSEDIRLDWKIIQITATEILQMYSNKITVNKPSIKEVKKRNPEFGTSLLLANSPMIPKIMNGSYVAIFDNTEAIDQFIQRFGNAFGNLAKDSPSLRRRIRGLSISNKQYSLDSRMDLMNSIVATAMNLSTASQRTSTPKEKNCLKESISEEDDSSNLVVCSTKCQMCGQVTSKEA
ncbi:histidine decarboxylase-like [Centruroides sculpturatus]|uniref:histidine decarboxylase-like n=1 Tax=Centruroides sculpturatus TaxID=218467 RepID=UPI000C6EDCC5|nr:histidine decarboxylase-like [Centruroides sculpturatus]